MSDKKTHWITTVNGTHAQVSGDEERDKWTPLGWRVADEPGPTDFVYMRKDGIEGRGVFAYGAAPTWQEMGWEYAGPPDPVDVTKDPLFSVEQGETPRPKKAAQKNTTSESADGAAEKKE